MILKDELIEPGTGFREQLDEMVKGFPKVQKALNISESCSEWYDSQGDTGSILENDEDAMAKTEKVILNSYQTFLQNKFGEPAQHGATPSQLTNEKSARQSMAEMTR